MAKNKDRIPPIVYVIVAVAIVFIGIIFFKGPPGVIDKADLVEKRLAVALNKYKIGDNNILRTDSEEKASGDERYVFTYCEYNVPAATQLKGLSSSIKEQFRKSEFRVSKNELALVKGAETLTMRIAFGKFDIFSLKFAKPKVVTPPPVVTKKPGRAKLAIVLDDFGYTMSNMDEILAIKQPVTLSILPGLKYSAEVAKLARANNKEIILHLPLESQRKDVRPEFNTIKTGMTKKEVLSKLDADLSSFQGLSGVSNHTGSKATEDKALMTAILSRLKEKNLYFLDSLTTDKSVCKSVATSMGEKFARRNVFIDNSNNVDYIKKQLLSAKNLALTNGQAIAIGHDRKNTIAVLGELMPKIEEEGVEFVRVSELAK